MTKINVQEVAKELQSSADGIFEKIAQYQSEVSDAIKNVKTTERKLIEKERLANQDRIERERKERLLELFSSDSEAVVHVGGFDDESESAQAVVAYDAKEEPTKPAVAAKEEASAVVAVPVKEEIHSEQKLASEAPIKTAAQTERVKADDRPRQQNANERGSYQKNDFQKSGYQKNDFQKNDFQKSGYQKDGFQKPGYQPSYQNQGQGRQQPNVGRPQGAQRPSQQQRPTAGQQRPTAGQQRPAAEQQRPAAGQQSSGFVKRPAAGTAPPVPQQRFGGGEQGKGGFTKSYEQDKHKRNKKSMQKGTAPSVQSWDEDGQMGGRRKPRKQQQQHKPEPVIIERAVITTEQVTVKDLSEKIGKPAGEIIKKLFMLGIVATINQELDFDTVELIASDYGIALEQQIAKTFEEVLTDAADEVDAPEDLAERSPIVTIMGHVDHGKTSLLDAIRDSSVTAGEAGGITQHIGAYTVMQNGRSITFIDTPGHEAFTSMRARGAQVTDIVILVVAADDGIMPQTIEAISHAKEAGVPIIVAINKMDKPEANPERIKQQLTEHALVSEEWGGDTIVVPVSAKTRDGIGTLLEMVLLQADVLELKANPNRLAKGAIIEARLDKGRGPIATVLVQNGTLHVGDPIVAGTTYGRVRAMMDDKGKRVKEAGPSTPVEVLGFNEVPLAGDMINVAEIDKLSRQVAEERRDKLKAEQLKNLSKISLDDLFNQIAEGEIKDLNIIVKADVQGSVEAVKQALEKLSQEEVRVRCIHGGVGAITGSDIMFASASNAIITGFNVRMDATARAAAEREGVDVRMYRVIYSAIEDIENAMKGMFKPVFKEVELGRASVRETFKVSGVGTIAGSYVQEGKINRNAQIRVVRDGIVIHEGKISSLKRFKEDTREVLTNYECGIGIEGFNDLRQGDIIEAFEMEEIKR